jgi:hypothetical protein
VQIRALSSAQLTGLTSVQVSAMETADLAAMTTAQYRVLSLITADMAALSTDQINALLSATPMVLDLDGHGVQTLAAQQGVQFDLNGTGHTQQVGWVAGNDGLLVMDRNGDGVINNGNELFGSGTVLANGKHAVNGYQAMAAEDSNHDGQLTAADATFGKLQVWVDANHDGKTDLGELKGLADVGIVSLDLHATAGSTVDNGNVLGLVSSYTTADGARHDMADVWLAKQAAVPPVGDLLSAPPKDLLPAGPAPAEHAVQAAPAVHGPAHGHAWRDDDLQNQVPLI